MLSPVPSSNNLHIVIVKRGNETNGVLCSCSVGNDRALSARSHCNFGALFALYSATAANVVEQQLGVDVWTAWMITVLWWLLLLTCWQPTAAVTAAVGCCCLLVACGLDRASRAVLLAMPTITYGHTAFIIVEIHTYTRL